MWLGDLPLAQQYPSLYNLVHHKNVLVANVLMMVQLSDSPDKFVWKLTPSGLFTVKLMYLDLMNGHTRFLRKYLWKLKIPLKIKIFMWFLNNKVLLSKDNLAKHNWNGCQKCCFCDL